MPFLAKRVQTPPPAEVIALPRPNGHDWGGGSSSVFPSGYVLPSPPSGFVLPSDQTYSTIEYSRTEGADGSISTHFTKNATDGFPGAELNGGTFPWEYQSITIVVTGETKTPEFSKQWLGVHKDVVLKTFGEPKAKRPYPADYHREVWYYSVLNSKWFLFFDTTTDRVTEIQLQNPGQPLLTTGSPIAEVQDTGHATSKTKP